MTLFEELKWRGLIHNITDEAVIDKINKTDNIKVYDTFIDSHKPELYQNISETINIEPNSKKYNIN